MKKILALAVIVVSLFSCNPIEYDMFGTIEGKVVDYETNEPIEYVSVQLSPGSKNTTSTSDGSFSFEELDARQYSLTVQKNGYETNMKNVNVIASETTEVIITIKKRNY